MKAKLFLFGIASAILMTTQIALAADAKIGFVDAQKALTKTKFGAKAQKDLEAERKSMQDKIDTKKSEFDKAVADLTKQKDSLSEKARREKEEATANLRKDLERMAADSQEQLKRKEAEVLRDFGQKMQAAIAAIGKEEGFTAIYPRQIAAYVSDSVDITEKAVKKYDEMNK